MHCVRVYIRGHCWTAKTHDARDRVGDPAELETGESSTRFEHPISLLKDFGDVGTISNAKSNRCRGRNSLKGGLMLERRQL